MRWKQIPELLGNLLIEGPSLVMERLRDGKGLARGTGFAGQWDQGPS